MGPAQDHKCHTRPKLRQQQMELGKAQRKVRMSIPQPTRHRAVEFSAHLLNRARLTRHGTNRCSWLVLLGIHLNFWQPAAALDNGLARTPYMGYSTWNAFHDDISESHIREATELMLNLGFRDAGYTYINIDDGWAERLPRAPGPIRANQTRFPAGIKAVADFVHAKGFKLGIYSDTGFQTCARYVSSSGHEVEDARQFAEWGVDLLKYDNCWISPDLPPLYERYKAMRDALNKTGRPILYAMCEWGASAPWLYGSTMGNSWRTTKDISLDIEGTWDGVVHNLINNVNLAKYAGPGGWNDADMLLVGLPGSKKLSLAEQQSHFALWALMKSPLIVGADLRLITPEQIAILTNPEVVAINQDPLGVPGDLIWKEGSDEVYAAPLANGSRAVVLLSRRHIGEDRLWNALSLTVTWRQLGYPPHLQVRVRDLVARADLGIHAGLLTLVVGKQLSRTIKLTPLKTEEEFNSWRPWHMSMPTNKTSASDDLHSASAHAYRPALDDLLLNSKPSAWHAEGTEGVIGAGFVMGFVVCLLLLGAWLVRPQKHAKNVRL